MRMRATKERRGYIREFVYKYREEIAQLKTEGYKAVSQCTSIKSFIDSKARPELEYSPRTYWIDIWLYLRRQYDILFGSSF